MAQESNNAIVRVILGGRTRQASSYAALKGFTKSPEIVLIHDAVRPFVTESILRENIQQAILHGAVNTCIPTADTLVHAPTKRKILTIPKREEYLRGQTPQTFRMDWAMDAHETALRKGIENSTDDCRLVLNLGHPVQVVLGDEQNLKITSEFDLFIAEQLLSSLFSQIDKGSTP
jgi:2-C-methyl-D-erythritol 4-phosphate cytidylyltransferase